MEENKEVKEKQDGRERIQISIDNTDDALNWLERILALLKEYGPFKIIGATILIVFVSSFLYFMLNFDKTLAIYDAWKDRQHDEKMEIRMQMGPKIQGLIDKLTYGVGASRTVVLELHNGNTGNGGLPFAKCTATYEALNIGKTPVSSQYQDVNLSLMPFANLLFKDGYWCGDVDSIENIDRGLYYKMKSNNTEHFASCVIEGVNNRPIAFMIVSFDQEVAALDKHNCNITRNNIRHIAMELAVILEVTRIINE